MSPTDGPPTATPADRSDRSGPLDQPPPSRTPARRSRPPRDNKLLRRGIMTGVVLLALGLFVLAGFVADTDSATDVGVSGDVVERLIPSEDFAVLQQNPVGVDLAPGWGVSAITVNGVSVPETEWDVTPELGLYQVIPTDGQTVERLVAQENCVQVTAFELLDPTATETIDWCFTAT